MALKQSFFDLLEHLGTTSTTSELFHASPDANIIAMRHDVDHDLELALEMAHHEWRLGYKATYYLLHTESYWNDEKFPLLVRQLKEYGHEIGLHVNSYSSWTIGQCKDPNRELLNAIEKLQSCGVEVKGVCAHGDKLCYKHGFINYWMWEELRGDNPEVTEEGMSAEGIRVDDEAYQIPYPTNHFLEREDGQSIPLWNLSMEEHGIEYDAAHLAQDHYWSDSGGKWTRTGSPMDSDLSKGRHQVLVHPWWWRDEPKSIFVLSNTKDEASRLSKTLQRSSSALCLLDWSLNHVRIKNRYINKRWLLAIVLLGGRKLLQPSNLLKTTRAFHYIQKRDVIEVTSLLDHMTEQMQSVIPNAVFISIANECSANQSETNCSPSTLNTILIDKDDLLKQLEMLGIVIHPYLLNHTQ